MRTVDRQVMIEQEAQQFITPARPRVCWSPEKAMMNEQEVGAGFRGLAHSGETGIHSRRDFGDGAAILHLQAVDRPGPIRKLSRAQDLVAISDKRREGSVFHVKTKLGTGRDLSRKFLHPMIEFWSMGLIVAQI